MAFIALKSFMGQFGLGQVIRPQKIWEVI